MRDQVDVPRLIGRKDRWRLDEAGGGGLLS